MQVPDAAKADSQVPVWSEGLDRPVLPADHQRILEVPPDRCRLGQGPLTCREVAALFRMDMVPVRVEALRSKARRLVAGG